MIYVAWLRGINVGGKAPVAMPVLKSCFENLGFTKVKTYINSGNIVFESDKKDTRKLEAVIEKALIKQFKFDIKVVVRSLPEIETLLGKIPEDWFTKAKRCNVIFLKHHVDSPKILDELETKPKIEGVSYVPGTVLWWADWDELKKSNMIKLSSKPVYQDMTARSPSTVRKIHELMLAAQSS